MISIEDLSVYVDMIIHKETDTVNGLWFNFPVDLLFMLLKENGIYIEREPYPSGYFMRHS